MARKWSDWIEWNGGECPVPPETVVDVVLQHHRDNGESWPAGHERIVMSAYEWVWEHMGGAGDIVRYAIAIATDEADA